MTSATASNSKKPAKYPGPRRPRLRIFFDQDSPCIYKFLLLLLGFLTRGNTKELRGLLSNKENKC